MLLLFVVKYVHRTLTVHDFALLPLPLRFSRTLSIAKSPILRPASSLTCTVFSQFSQTCRAKTLRHAYLDNTAGYRRAHLRSLSGASRIGLAEPRPSVVRGAADQKSLRLKISRTRSPPINLRVAIESSHSLLPKYIYFCQGFPNSFSDMRWLPFFCIG